MGPLPRSDRCCPTSKRSNRSRHRCSCPARLGARAEAHARVTAAVPLRSLLQSWGPAAPVRQCLDCGTPFVRFGAWERRFRRMSARLDGAAVPKAGCCAPWQPSQTREFGHHPLPGPPGAAARLRDNLRLAARLTAGHASICDHS